MKKFDTHVHIFPDKLEGKVLPKLSLISGTPYYGTGILADTTEKMKNYGIDGCLFLNIATNVRQQASVNNFAFELCQKGYSAFGSVHPDAEDSIEMLHNIKEQGLKGVKFHPDYQEFMVDDKKMEAIYAECEKLGLIAAFHAGWDPLSPDLVHCPPERLKNVAEAFPKLKIIAAHMGGMKRKDEVKAYLAGRKNIWLDTAFASFSLTSDELFELIRLHGTERVLFATDFPWSTPDTESALIENTALTESEKEAIYYYNAAELLELE